jgi:hypothetical protein
MAADDVARGLMLMDDPAVRSRVAGEERSALGEGMDLSEGEWALLVSAAFDDPEVRGFYEGGGWPGAVGPDGQLANRGLQGAAAYVTPRVVNPQLRSSFTRWVTTKQAQGFAW